MNVENADHDSDASRSQLETLRDQLRKANEAQKHASTDGRRVPIAPAAKPGKRRRATGRPAVSES